MVLCWLNAKIVSRPISRLHIINSMGIKYYVVICNGSVLKNRFFTGSGKESTTRDNNILKLRKIFIFQLDPRKTVLRGPAVARGFR